jgi:hypothetical protein
MQLLIDRQSLSSSHQFEVRVISRREDPYFGLKGHAYIKARGLNKLVPRHVQTSAQEANGEVSK